MGAIPIETKPRLGNILYWINNGSFSPIFDESKLHPHFRVLIKNNSEPLRRVIESWSSGFVDRDNKFVKEFQTTFNSSFWELYLYAAFKHLNMEVDFSKSSPDFTVVTDKHKKLSLEAVTANHAQFCEPEWEAKPRKDKLSMKSRNEILEYASIRLLNAINSKHTMYLKKYGQMDHVRGNPFILAIAPFEQPEFSRQNNQAINRVLYACDAPKINGIDVNGQVNLITEPLCQVTKDNGKTKLELGVFTTPAFKEISAVIFSTTATFSKVIVQSDLDRCIVQSRRYKCGDGWFGFMDQWSEKRVYRETHLDGLHIYYNPYATNPLNRDIFFPHELTHNTYDVKSNSILSDHKDGALISRSTYWNYDE